MKTEDEIGDIALRADCVSKRFPGVVALNRVDLDLRRGEVHALLGENGAGKSTLIKIIGGIYSPDEGELLINDRPVRFRNPKAASHSGVTVVAQDIQFLSEFSIGRNILLGSEGALARREDLTRMERNRVDDALRLIGANFSATSKTSTLSVAHLRLAQIARALVRRGDILIFDEPTAVLSEPDSEQFLARIDQLRSEGKAILYVTHRLSEALRLADRVTILRDGRRVGLFARGELSRENIVRLMVKQVAETTPPPLPARSSVMPAVSGASLRVANLSLGGRFDNVNMSARPGQIVGIAGVQGSGHGQFLRAVAGVDRADAGAIFVDEIRLPLGSVGRAVKAGILLVPADRLGASIVPSMSIRANLAISGRIRRSARRFGLRWPSVERGMTRTYIRQLGIRPSSSETLTAALSGGNQQKVALARGFEAGARILLIEEPTQGVDVGAKAELHSLLRYAAIANGCTIVIASSEFEELIGLADEIHVMREGRVVASVAGADATHAKILEHALS